MDSILAGSDDEAEEDAVISQVKRLYKIYKFVLTIFPEIPPA